MTVTFSQLHFIFRKKTFATISSKPHSLLIEGERLALTCQANEATNEIRWTKDDISEIARASVRQKGGGGGGE